MEITKQEIDNYLIEVKTAVRAGRYKIAWNSRRQENMNLFTDYVIDETDARNILLSLR